MVRVRLLANTRVPLKAYIDSITSWVLLPPIVDILHKLGPNLVSDTRRVTPAMFQCTKVLIDLLIVAGCSNGVVQGLKLQEAMVVVYQQQPQVQTDDWNCKSNEKVKDHILCILMMLRDLKYEHAKGEYKRAGPFRHKRWSQLLINHKQNLDPSL